MTARRAPARAGRRSPPSSAPRGALRQTVGEQRPGASRPLAALPRPPPLGRARAAASRAGSRSPARPIWSGGPEDDAAAASALEAIVARDARAVRPVLLIVALDRRGLAAAAPRMRRTCRRSRARSARRRRRPRRPRRRRAGRGAGEDRDRPAPLRGRDGRDRLVRDPSVADLVDGDRAIVASLARPAADPPRARRRASIRSCSTSSRVGSGDALLQAACAFMTDGQRAARRRIIARSAAAPSSPPRCTADRKLDRIARSFDFLLSSRRSTPPRRCDAVPRRQAARSAPRFRYRPLTVDPDARQARALRDRPATARGSGARDGCCREKRRELDHQLTMLATRNTPALPARLADALRRGRARAARATRDAILAATRPPARRRGRDDRRRRGRRRGARAGRPLPRAPTPASTPKVELRDDIAAGLMVSGRKLMISSDTRDARATGSTPLLAHEVSVHLLTCFNGAAQGLTIFRTGLAGYEGVQEGLGVFAEWAVGGLTRTRLRLLAGAGRRGRRDARRRRLHRGLPPARPRSRLSASAAAFNDRRAGLPLGRARQGRDLSARLQGGDRPGRRRRRRSTRSGSARSRPAMSPAIEELLQRGSAPAAASSARIPRRARTRSARIARLRAGPSLRLDPRPGVTAMLIAFFVNDMDAEYRRATRPPCSPMQAAQRGHRVCYITPVRFRADARRQPARPRAASCPSASTRTAPNSSTALKEVGGKIEPIDIDRGRRADAAQRSRRSTRRTTPWAADIGILFGREAAKRGVHRAQRSRQPRPGDQQALFPVLPGRGARRDPDHQARRRHQGVRQGAWRQHHPEAAAGLGRVGRVQGRRQEQVATSTR